MKEINIAIIGCGRISGHHCRSIIDTDGIKLVAVCDLILEKAQFYGNEFNVKFYVNYHQMLDENPNINIVAIMTPSGMHYEHAVDIIKNYKKSVVVEKPTFMTPSQMENAFKLAKEVGVEIFPVFQNRFNLAVMRVLRGLACGELGQLRTVAVRVRWCRKQEYYDQAPWRGTFSMDGGVLTNQGIHHVDLLRLLGGEVERVCADFDTLGAQIEVEDTATAVIRFSSGAIGTLEITTAARPIDFEASISLVCEHGLAQIGGIAVNELQIYTPDPESCIQNTEDFSGNVYGSGHKKIYKEIVSHLVGESDYTISFRDAHNTIRLLNAFYLSYESGGWIKVSESGDSKSLGSADEALACIYRTKKLTQI